MASERKQNKTESLVMRYISEIIRLDVKSRGFGIVNITACKITPDLSLAKIYLTFLGSENQEESLAILNESRGFIRSRLASQLTLRKVPNLEFIIDKSSENAEIIDSILRNITK